MALPKGRAKVGAIKGREAKAPNPNLKRTEDNGYMVVGPSHESCIDGIWNEDSVGAWLIEIQLPAE